MSDDEFLYDDNEDFEDSEEEEVEDYNDDPLLDNSNAYKPIKLHRSHSFEVIEKTDLAKESDKLIADVIDVLGISHPAATTLLAYMKYVSFYTTILNFPIMHCTHIHSFSGGIRKNLLRNIWRTQISFATMRVFLS